MESAHLLMAKMRELHRDWVWNRSDTHVVLGEPGSLEAFKVPVEPGNSFSPGIGTYGLSTWIFDNENRTLHTPETKSADMLEWRFMDGHIPVLISSWTAGLCNIESTLFVSGDNETSDYKAYLRISIENKSGCDQEPSVLLAIRSFGAAGGPINQLSASDDGHQVSVNGHPSIFCRTAADGVHCVGYDRSGTDISTLTTQGDLPDCTSIADKTGWGSGVVEYRPYLEPNQKAVYDFLIPIYSSHHLLYWLTPPSHEFDFDAVLENFIAKWQKILYTVKLDVPDKRISDAFYSQTAHNYMATVHNAVRISPISYPMWWLRDGVYLLNALDKAGLHSFVRKAVTEIMPMDAFGGMGAEGDGPGESIWIATEHWLLTRDAEYLEQVYPHIKRKADLLITMIHTDKPIKRLAEFRTTDGLLNPGADILCGPAKDGLIVGRMDWHYPVFWVNSFAYAGLMRAARCARALQDTEKAELWEAEAKKLRSAIMNKMSEFGKNERDITGAIWPNKTLRPDDPGILEAFDKFWNGTRCPGGRHNPESLWTYFELGQAHNYMFLGMRDRMWTSLDYFLDHHTSQGLYTWSEGDGDENSSGLWQKTRGWDKIRYITPHGWTSAEMFLLIRDAMVYEWETDEGEALVVGAGVPKEWGDSAGFGVKDIPTAFGACSWRYEGGVLSLESETVPPGGYIICLPFDVPMVDIGPTDAKITFWR